MIKIFKNYILDEYEEEYYNNLDDDDTGNDKDKKNIQRNKLKTPL